MPRVPLFTSAYAHGALTPAQVLAFHGARFGGLRMEDEPSGDEPSGDGASSATETFTDPDTKETYNFPAGKPTADMTDAQRTEYWRHKARKHEGAAKSRDDYDAIKAERDRLKAATQTDADKAIEQARNDAKTATEAELTQKFAGRLVAAEFKAALAGKRKADEITDIVEALDLRKFLTANGDVDTDKVSQHAARLAPAGTTWPDTGQGNRGSGSSAKGVAAGADLYAASRGAKTT